ncbi:hypothetical protein OEZ86_013238 [Tetradesmus obliquus]|nr:hypothetical protein OEZ86_013238 [Tetradesmus obliquus]
MASALSALLVWLLLGKRQEALVTAVAGTDITAAKADYKLLEQFTHLLWCCWVLLGERFALDQCRFILFSSVAFRRLVYVVWSS